MNFFKDKNLMVKKYIEGFLSILKLSPHPPNQSLRSGSGQAHSLYLPTLTSILPRPTQKDWRVFDKGEED